MRNILSASYLLLFAFAAFTTSCNKYLETDVEKTGVLNEQEYYKELDKLRTETRKNTKSIGLAGIQDLYARFEEYDYPCWELIKVYSDINALCEEDHFLYSVYMIESELRKQPSSDRLTIFNKTKPILQKSQDLAMKKHGKSIYRLGDKEFKTILIEMNYEDAIRAVLTPEELAIAGFR